MTTEIIAMKRTALILGALAGLLGFHSAQGRCSENPHDRWNDLVLRGKSYLAADLPEDALILLQEADEIDLPEVPNYQALVAIAEARCLLGDAVVGRALIQDFRCMLAVDAGRRPCYIGPPTRSGPGHPNPDLTPTCFERMCSEIFLSYYRSPTAKLLARLEELSEEASRVETVCAGSNDED